MCRKALVRTALLLTALWIGACSAHPLRTPTPTGSSFATPDSRQSTEAAGELTFETQMFTLEAYLSTLSSMTTQMSQQLELVVEELKPGCHSFGDPIAVRFTFRNMANEAYLVQSRFAMSPNQNYHGDMHPLITTVNGEPISSSADLEHRSELAMDWEAPTDFVELRPGRRLETVLTFHFPTDTIRYGGTEMEKYEHLPPGQYRVRFEYHNIRIGPSDTWVGSLYSNTIELCLAEPVRPG